MIEFKQFGILSCFVGEIRVEVAEWSWQWDVDGALDENVDSTHQANGDAEDQKQNN